MHVLLQNNQLRYLFFVFITSTTSIPIGDHSQIIQCDWLHKNCTFIQRDSLPINNRLLSSTTTQYPSTSVTYSDRSSHSKTLKLAALTIAGVALCLVILRICLMLCNSSRSSTTSRSNPHTATVRPEIAIIGQNSFKPDLPPDYAEAIAINNDIDGNKLPSYDELQNGQHTRRSTNE